jgi:hypothetical protein
VQPTRLEGSFGTNPVRKKAGAQEGKQQYGGKPREILGGDGKTQLSLRSTSNSSIKHFASVVGKSEVWNS